jgi:putative ABC transport system ATP-binding protein
MTNSELHLGINSNLLVQTVNLHKEYTLGSERIIALENINLQIEAGTFVAIIGRSGSGKTTLLNLMAGLDQPTSGEVLILGRSLSKMNSRELTAVRRNTIGFIFQSFGLIPLLTAFENVELPLRIAGVDSDYRQKRAKEVLEMVGLWARSHHRPYELSGGEQQRVSIARAIANKPPLILADEPTGELDSSNSWSIFSLFKEMVREESISVVSATHDSTLLDMADEVKEINDGSLASQFDKSHSKRFR